MVDLSRRTCLILLVLMSLAVVLAACGDSDNGEGASPLAQPSLTIDETASRSDEPVVIIIGNLTDITGAGAASLQMVDMALDDLIRYYNENNLIPGVEFKVIKYDTQYNPAKFIPGYEWLREKGADMIYTALPPAPTTLKSRADQDEFVIFAVAADEEGILPPGYVFNLGIDPEHEAYTLLSWIAENDWDYAAKGPAKIGGAAWNESYSNTFMTAMEKYCSAHPEQFEWEEGFLTNFNFRWGSEIEALKDCDYVFPGAVMFSFVEQYREAGYTEAKFIGSDPAAAFLGRVDWKDIDEMLFVMYCRWWNEEGKIIDLAKQLVREYRPDDAEFIMRSGVGYLGVFQTFGMLNIVADAVEAAGPENLDSEALYDAAESFVLSDDGVQRASFSNEKRNATDSYGIYEARADEEELFRMHDEWLPAVRHP